VMVL